MSLTIRDLYVPFLFVHAPADIDDLAMLAEFAQLAMARARAASARAEAIEAEGGDPAAHLMVFDRMGRAMRLALSLRRRFIGEAQAEAVRRVQARKERLRAAISPAIRLHAPMSDRLELDWTLDQRLETEADTLEALPFEKGLARLCRLLGLPEEAYDDHAAEAPQACDDDVPAGEPGVVLTPGLIARARHIAARATGPP